MSSPPSRVTIALRTWGLIDVLKKRIEPSAIDALNPPGCLLPIPSSGSGDASDRSCGLAPGNRVRRLDDHERIRSAVGHARERNPRRLAREHRAGDRRRPRTSSYPRGKWPRSGIGTRWHPIDERLVIGAVPRLVEVELVVEARTVPGTAGSAPASSGAACRLVSKWLLAGSCRSRSGSCAWRSPICFRLIRALRTAGRLAGGLDGRQGAGPQNRIAARSRTSSSSPARSPSIAIPLPVSRFLGLLMSFKAQHPEDDRR